MEQCVRFCVKPYFLVIVRENPIFARMKIAIVGTGISGLVAAWLLSRDHDITVYEAADRLGGHSRTIDIKIDDKNIPVDTGFIVFNNWNYPNLLGLFDHLNVPYENSNMSFGVSIADGFLEYSSNTILTKGRNLRRPEFYGMLRDILTFNRKAPRLIKAQPDLTLGQCIDTLGIVAWCRDYYLLAMGAAIWSCPTRTMLDFPARTLVQFFENHGLLNLIKRPQWYTVTGGSRQYISHLTASFQDKIRLNCGVKKIKTNPSQHGQTSVTVLDETGHSESYDHVVLACHANQALAMIESPTSRERDILGDFGYQSNTVVVHTDQRFMPKDRRCWASWVYLSQTQKDEKPAVSLTYWMNNLQNFASDKPVLVTLNPEWMPKASTILDQTTFTHPVFNEAAVQAQSRLPSIQNQHQRGLSFCGAWQRYGFHEDGLLSAVNVVKNLGGTIPWQA